MEDKQECDLNIVYDYKEYPDKVAGRCDNCEKTLDNIFLREYRKCGMKKSI